MSADATLQTQRHDAVSMRKAKAYIVLLDEQYGIAYAQRGAIELLSRMLKVPIEYMDRLPLPIELALQDAVRGLSLDDDTIIEPVPSLRFRVAKLSSRAQDTIVALQIEHVQRREALPGAIKRFKLTARESSVLSLILRGRSSNEIADEMSIAEATVADYVKRLLRKTFSRNRAEMLAKIFDWDPAEGE